MRRAALTIVALVATLLLPAAAAQAVVPALGPVSATNIQGVSALLKGTVDPEGLATTYQYEYSTQSNFSGVVKTSVSQAGQGSQPVPARASLSGLAPNTTYHFRLAATNSSGTNTSTPSLFVTTKGFGFLPGEEGFAVRAIKDGGAPETLPGGHPYALSFKVGLNQGGEFENQPGAVFPDGDIRDLHIETPAGLIENPAALPKCTLAEFHTPRDSPFEESRSGESCPAKSQVGTVEIQTSLEGGQVRRFGLFNLTPAPGTPAQIGFSPYGAPIALNNNLRPVGDGSYSLTLDATAIPQFLDIHGMEVVLWGTPWAVSHNGERGNCLNEAEAGYPWAKCTIGDPRSDGLPLAYLSLPHKCSGPLAFTARATSWQQGGEVSSSAVNRNGIGQQVEMGPCSGFDFEPKAVGLLDDAKASSPAGYEFRYSVDSRDLTDPAQQSPVAVKTATVQLPAGVTINPSVGAGLGACSAAQYAAENAFSAGTACPNGAKIGDFEVRTPLFEEAFKGAVYLAQPDDPATSAPGAENPFDSLVAVYLIARMPARGVAVKVPGKIIPDPGTGQLTATFDGLPQIPYTDLRLNFRPGQRSFLITPATCGGANTTTDLSPWAGSQAVHSTSATQITSGIGGGPCPSGAQPYSPKVIAGGVNSNVNSYTPYFIHLSRQDTEQEITSYSLVLPEGITGKLAGIPFCPDAAVEAARSRQGFAENASPSCPAASEVGHTLSGYGIGSSLTYATGKIYLAGPYNGQPLSLVLINPATVGPFDLGNVVIRSAFSVNERTAQLQIDSSASDRIPHILGGIPLHLRDVLIYMDRYQFTHNPSSCAPSQLTSTLTGAGSDFTTTADDSSSTSSVHFQLLNCRTLGFKPKLEVALKGGTKRRAYPQLTVTFTARGQGDSNLKEIAVSMPHSEFLAQEHIKSICTRVQFAAEKCPADSVYGSAVAYTPLFDEPLKGNVYLRSNPKRQLPDLVASLYSGAVHITLEGEISGNKQGGIRALFRELPDEPLDKFVMTLNGGKRGLLQNSSNICVEPPLATVRAMGQANLGSEFSSILRGQCKKTKKRSHKRGNR